MSIEIHIQFLYGVCCLFVILFYSFHVSPWYWNLICNLVLYMDDKAYAKSTKNNAGLKVIIAGAVQWVMKHLQAWRYPHPIKNKNRREKIP